MTQNVLLKSVSILFIASIIAKIVGAIYRIPLTWILGAEGLGIYQLVFPIFSLLLVLSSTGAPTVLSTMVSSRVGKGEIKNAQLVFKQGLKILVLLGFVAGLLLCCFSFLISNIQGNKDAFVCYIILAFAIPLVSVLSAYRGYFQGLMNMVPTALSQIVEQFSKLIFGLLLSLAFVKNGALFGAVGAILGVVLSEVFAVLFVVVYKKIKDKRQFCVSNCSQNYILETKKFINQQFFLNAIPIVLCSLVLPIMQVVDSVLIIPLLNFAGFSALEGTKMWGVASGVVNSLINLPVVLSLGVAVSIAPALRTKLISKQQTNEKISSAFKMALNISLPMSVLLFVLAELVVCFLYQQSSLGAEMINLATKLLLLNAPFVVLISFVQTQNAVLQGLGKLKIPLLNMLVAGVVKFGLLFLCANNQINIFGLIISNTSFYAVTFLLNYIYIRKHFGFGFKIKEGMPCLISSLICGVILFLGTLAWVGMNLYVKLFLLLFVGGIVYFSTMLVLGEIKAPFFYLKKLKNVVYKQK